MVSGDAPTESDGESAYECLDCGETVVAETTPVACPVCESALRNRGTPLE